jgi:hypothetical protein
MKSKSMAMIAATLLVSACATSYQPKGLTGGFDEVQLDTNVYQVRFRGNGYTSADGGQTIRITRPSATNVVLMVNDRADVQGMTYDAAITARSLKAKYGVE